jgi:hypothetical protein
MWVPVRQDSQWLGRDSEVTSGQTSRGGEVARRAASSSRCSSIGELQLTAGSVPSVGCNGERGDADAACRGSRQRRWTVGKLAAVQGVVVVGVVGIQWCGVWDAAGVHAGW